VWNPPAEQAVRRLRSQSRACFSIGAHCYLLRAAGSGAALARALGLHRRARQRAVGTEHATIARLWLQFCAAAGAFIEELAGISRHGLRFRERAVRTDDGRLKKHRISSWARTDSPPWWWAAVGSHRL
jgi:hypothetical protein